MINTLNILTTKNNDYVNVSVESGPLWCLYLQRTCNSCVENIPDTAPKTSLQFFPDMSTKSPKHLPSRSTSFAIIIIIAVVCGGVCFCEGVNLF